ncbi:MAG TPA: type II secretion system protein [Solidesulfovibrio sp.]|nr:type II secretion system protein [Solidesulfovibrio sp.]
MDRPDFGFTLIELVAVILTLAIFATAALVRYSVLLDDSRRRVATGLVASAQSQLTLEYSRRIITGNPLAVSSQDVCDMVSLSNSGQDVSLSCSGHLSDEDIAVRATVEGQSANANWFSPQSGS